MEPKTTIVSVRNSNESIYHYRVVIYRDEDGVYIAECPALEGCMTDGATFEKVLEGIKDVVACYVGALKELGKPIPREPEYEDSAIE